MGREVIPWTKLFEAAGAAQRRAYAPYSKFVVGAAVWVEGGQIRSGCNVENATYGLTVCAERNAIYRAIAEFGARKLLAVAIISRSKPPSPPCGMCRQVMFEFAGRDVAVRCRNLIGEERRYRLSRLLPAPFSQKYL